MKHSGLFRLLIEKSILGVVLCGLLVLPGAAILCAQTYTLKDLGTLDGGDLSAAYGINDAGQVVGSTKVPGSYHATLFSGTGVKNTDLGTLGGSWSVAFSINNAGQTVGEASIITNNNISRGTF